MTHEEAILHIKKILKKWDEKWFEETRGNPVLEERKMWFWEECVEEIRPFLNETK